MTPEGAERLVERFARDYPDALRLAEVVSLAVRVEPELLRAARLRLLPGVEAGAEADLWFSPLVQSRSPAGIVFHAAVTHLLRRRLTENDANDADGEKGGLLSAAWEVVEGAHRHTSPAVLLEERLAWLALSGQDEEVKRHLRSAVATLIDPARRELSHWVARAFPRLPDDVKGLEEAQMLLVGARLRLGLRGEDEGTDAGALPEWVSWLKPSDLPRVECGVTLYEGAVELCSPPLPGAHVIHLLETDPLSVEVHWREGEAARVERVRLKPGVRRMVEVGYGEVRLRNGLGDTYHLMPRQEAMLSVELRFKGIEDFGPDRLAPQIDSLAELLRVRGALANMLVRLDGHDGLNNLLVAVLENPKARKQLRARLGVGPAPAG